MKAFAALLVAVVCLVSAPTPTTAVSCTFTDAPTAIANKKNCDTITLSNINVPAGTTLDMTSLKDNAQVTFAGTTTFGYKEWVGPLISFSGTGIKISGASGHLIDCDGKRWWDGLGGNGGKIKPKFFAVKKLVSSTITGLKVKNTPVHAFSIQATDLKLTDITIDNSAGDVANGGHNTDAFDIGSSDRITITGANVKNQDDCLAVNSGTNIVFTQGYCSGGHGISIGSVGGRTDNDVINVTISSSTVINSDNGIRIKTVSNAVGSVKNVKFQDITLTGIRKYGIVIQQDYENGSPTGTPTTGVPITGLTVSGVTGSVVSTGTNIYILCGKGSCSNWSWSGIRVTGGKTSTKCLNVPSPATC